MAEIAARKQADRGGKVRLLCLDDLDRRTRACKQALNLRDGFLSDLGGEGYASTGQKELAQRAAILGAMLEDQEAKYLQGAPVELTDYCTMVNAQRRVLADIGLDRRPRDVTPSLGEYMASLEREKAVSE